MKLKKKIAWIAFAGVIISVVLWLGAAYSITGRNTDKLWLHRCNSLEKMDEMAERFPKIEVDLVYRGKGLFDVTHDEEVTFNLQVDSFLRRIGRSGNHMWLDIKNLDRGGYPAYVELDSLRRLYGVGKDQLIIESNSPDALKRFTDSGYYTSFYVPFEHPSKLSDKQMENAIDSLRRAADSGKAKALSFPGWWYNPIIDHLDRDIDLLTWKHRSTELEMNLIPSNRRMIDDSRLKVILVKAKGSYHR